MADLSVNPVAAQIKPPQQVSIGDIMNIARGAQAYQQAQQINPLLVQQQQAATQQSTAQASVAARAADEQKALAPILQDIPNHLDEAGNVDWNDAIPKIMAAAPTTGSEYISKLATAAKGATDAKKAVIGLNQDQKVAVSQQFQQIDPNNPGPGLQAVSAWSDQNPWAKPIIQQALQYHIVPALVQDQQNPNPKNPNANFHKEQTHMIETVMTPAERAESMKPSGPLVSTGQVTYQAQTNPFALEPTGQPVAGTVAQQQLPPGTQIYNPATQGFSYFGPGGQGMGANPIAAAPGLGVANQAIGVATAGAEDYAGLQKQATNAKQAINTLNNIKRFASGAATGVTSDWRAYTEGLLGMVGIKPSGDAKTNYDLLVKNSNMLTNAFGGNTDMARTLIEGANPNHKMTAEAIDEAANQLIGQQNYAVKKFNYMTNVMQAAQQQQKPMLYQQGLQYFNSTVDPAVTQYEAMSPAQRNKFKASMSPEQQKDFRQKIMNYENFLQGK
jgi:hypothetical protein